MFIAKPKKSKFHLEISMTLGCKIFVISRFLRDLKYKVKKCFVFNISGY